jgi:adenylylsulfate kinase
VWLTGLPASGKSTVTAALVARLAECGVDMAVLESDVWRRILTPHPTYDKEERDAFYLALVAIGQLLIDHGVSIIFDATANRRAYRDLARAKIPRTVEVYVDAPLAVCVERDPKGIYRRAQGDQAGHVPGLQDDYEPPPRPDVVVHSDREDPGHAAERILTELRRRGYIPTQDPSGPPGP